MTPAGAARGTFVRGTDLEQRTALREVTVAGLVPSPTGGGVLTLYTVADTASRMRAWVLFVLATAVACGGKKEVGGTPVGSCTLGSGEWSCLGAYPHEHRGGQGTTTSRAFRML